MLQLQFSKYQFECGTDEAGRGCLAGPVTAAAVILKKNFKSKLITDSKKLSKNQKTPNQTSNQACLYRIDAMPRHMTSVETDQTARRFSTRETGSELSTPPPP